MLDIKKQPGDDFTAEEFNKVVTEINGKVDAVKGKGLSSNDYTDEEKSKVEKAASIDVDVLLKEIEGKLSSGDVYSKEEINTMIEEARISLNLTDEQLASLNVNLTPIQNELKEINLFPVKGKTLLVLGDSLSSSNGGTMDKPAVGSWCKVLKNKLGLSDESRVIAIGGASLIDKNDTVLNPIKDNYGASDNVLSNQVYSVLDYKQRNPDYNPDIIMIMAGTNNVNTVYPYTHWDTLLGDWDEQMYNYVLNDNDYKLPDINTSDGLTRYNRLKTFRKKLYGAYRWMIETLLTNFPNSMLYVMSPLQNGNGRGLNIFELYPHLKKIADFYSCYYVDCAGESGLSYFTNMRKDKGWDKQWYTYDGTHPDSNGQILIGNYVAKFIQRTYFDKGTISATKIDQEETITYHQITTQIANGDNGIGGTLDKYGTISVIEGESLTVNITPNEGYEISEIIVDGVSVAINNSYTFSNVTSNHTMIVEFVVQAPVDPDVVPNLNSISINTGASTTDSADVSVKMTVTGTPTHYRISESSSGLSSASWKSYVNTVSYKLSGIGNKTIYVQVKNDVGESGIKSASIIYQESTPTDKRKAIMSITWGYADVGFDEASKIYKLQLLGSAKPFYDVSNVQMGTIKNNDTSLASNYSERTKGKITGDNSGIYPDFALQQNLCVNGTKLASITMTVPSGTYAVRLLSNISSEAEWGKYAADPSVATFVVNGVTKNPIKTTDNTDTLLVFDDVDASNGEINIQWSGGAESKRLAINVIEIEQL